MSEKKAAVSPMESYNRLLIERIDEQLRRGFDASLQGANHCVIKAGVCGILSVLPSSMTGEQHDIVFGPKSFAACIEYVNANLVVREERYGWSRPEPPHDVHESHGRTSDGSA